MSSFYFYIIFLVTIYILYLNQLQNNFPANPSVDRKSYKPCEYDRVRPSYFDRPTAVRKIKNKNKIK